MGKCAVITQNKGSYAIDMSKAFLCFELVLNTVNSSSQKAFISFELVLNTVNSCSQNRGKWNLQI